MGRETDTVRAVMQLLAAHRTPAWRMNTGAVKIGSRFLRFGSPGMADILGVLPGGWACFIEVKSTRGRMSQAQEAFREQVRAAGALYLMARSVTDVAKALNLPC